MKNLDAGMKPEPKELAWRLIEPHWDTIDFCGGDAEFGASWTEVPRHIALLLAVWWCESEVCNGGFEQFYSNSSGILRPEAARGFRAVGLPSMAKLVDESLRIIGDPFPRDRDERAQRVWGSRSDDASDPFRHLDDSFYAAQREHEYAETIDRYAARHLEAGRT